MGELIRQLDTTGQIGPEIPFHGILMLVVSGCTGGEEVWAEFLLAEFGMFLLVAKQPAVLFSRISLTESNIWISVSVSQLYASLVLSFPQKRRSSCSKRHLP